MVPRAFQTSIRPPPVAAAAHRERVVLALGPGWCQKERRHRFGHIVTAGVGGWKADLQGRTAPSRMLHYANIVAFGRLAPRANSW